MTFLEFIAAVAWPLVILLIVLSNWDSFRSLFDSLAKIAISASRSRLSKFAIGNAIKLEFEQRIRRGEIDATDPGKLAKVTDEVVEAVVADFERKALNVRVNTFDALPAPFTGLEIPLPSGHKIVMQLRSNEGWISSTDPAFVAAEDRSLPSAGLAMQGSGWRFDIR